MSNADETLRVVHTAVYAVTLATLVRAKRAGAESPVIDATIDTLCDHVTAGWGLGGAPLPHAGTAAPPTLQWPPAGPQLPDVYRENYYEPRGDTVTVRRTRESPDERIAATEGPFVFLGFVDWSTERQGYLMLMQARDGAEYWVHSKDVRPGKEIDGSGAFESTEVDG